MVQESGSKSHLNANTAVSRKDTGYVTDPAAGRYQTLSISSLSFATLACEQQY